MIEYFEILKNEFKNTFKAANDIGARFHGQIKLQIQGRTTGSHF